ncbi:hypothetical protein G6F55_013757 [Rhizopus delemar]|nr:hypothetical protein G6F55_013932 [Rhizopus delemar]KAG1439128.1 hypothetical protein G6F55_013800 [Rhizopus delemar]KAG1439320.1 hypothetical protein G6F55_013757 [Rhizopus delemar]
MFFTPAKQHRTSSIGHGITRDCTKTRVQITTDDRIVCQGQRNQHRRDLVVGQGRGQIQADETQGATQPQTQSILGMNRELYHSHRTGRRDQSRDTLRATIAVDHRRAIQVELGPRGTDPVGREQPGFGDEDQGKRLAVTK